MGKAAKKIETRNARVQLVVKPSVKNEWQTEADKRRWNLTTLIEVAIEEYLEKQNRRARLTLKK